MRRIVSIFRKVAATISSRVITKKIVKFTRNTYLTWPKRSRIILVVTSNLLKQENVCLIPRESEHPIDVILSFHHYFWKINSSSSLKLSSDVQGLDILKFDSPIIKHCIIFWNWPIPFEIVLSCCCIVVFIWAYRLVFLKVEI